ncbi:hypothetical protein CC78DRAFT_135045 [Lojkania enalia]|uniref:Glutaredoxin domain-containing protein n=1 Tax=Lojkania enalia TaxID=147567 RepID=A0A9P4NCF3_9PLEO|nr:hypothetical protein CC78DRAFT_135045 [Didymosphaeria enalia]
MAELAVYDNDPTLYLLTSLTAGSSHIITATSRIETILKANKIPFKGVDTATDELARKLYGRRARGKKLPLLVKEGFVLGDLEQIEEWNEYDELKEALGFAGTTPATAVAPATTTSTQPSKPMSKENVPSATTEQNLAIRQLGAEAAAVAASKKPVPTNISTTNPLLAEKVNSPATSTPTKAKADPSGILSPRSIPLPDTPKPAAEAKEDKDLTGYTIPKISQRPVKQTPPLHIDAANLSLNAGPISASQKSPSPSSSAKSPSLSSYHHRSGSSSSQTFHGAEVEDASPEEIEAIEKEQAIEEVSSSEEEDSEDERERLNRKASGQVHVSSAPETLSTGSQAKVLTKEAHKEEDEDEDDESEDETDTKPQQQSAKAADKAGDSVRD